MRYDRPAAIEPLSAVADQLVLPALAYWSVQPLRSTLATVGLKSSTKSFAYVAPALPPLAYTWLMTTPGDAPTADGVSTASSARARPRTAETRFMGGSDLTWTRCLLPSRRSRAPKVSVRKPARCRRCSMTKRARQAAKRASSSAHTCNQLCDRGSGTGVPHGARRATPCT